MNNANHSIKPQVHPNFVPCLKSVQIPQELVNKCVSFTFSQHWKLIDKLPTIVIDFRTDNFKNKLLHSVEMLHILYQCFEKLGSKHCNENINTLLKDFYTIIPEVANVKLTRSCYI